MDNFTKFHCDISKNFSSESEKVRGFVYYDYQIEPHTHDFYEINIILSGCGVHNIGKNSINAKTGAVFVIPPSVVHSYTDTENMDVYHILIKPEFINALLNDNNDENLRTFLGTEPLLRQYVAKDLYLSLNHEQMTTVKNELDALCENDNDFYPKTDNFKNATVAKLLYIFSHFMQANKISNSNDNHSYEDDTIQVLVSYIEQHYAENIDIDTLCDVVHLSRATLFRYFKKYFFCTPMDFVRKYRKSKAIDLLNLGKMSKTSIAHECGFYDVSHMLKVIKKSLS